MKDGKGLVVFHHASSAFTKPNWEEFEKAIAGGWRSQGFHGPKHVYSVKKTRRQAPDLRGPARRSSSTRSTNSTRTRCMVPGNEVLATAYSDPGKEKGNRQGRADHLGQHLRQGPRLQQRPGPRRRGHVRPQLPDLDAPRGDLGGDGKADSDDALSDGGVQRLCPWFGRVSIEPVRASDRARSLATPSCSRISRRWPNRSPPGQRD